MKVGQALGHYHVVRTLGRGGMGTVYEANDTRLNRQVALKVLPAKMANNAEWFKRFEREAQAVAALNHPNIVTIHSVEEAGDVHFIILELVGGKTLGDLIPEAGLPIEQFFDIAIPLADAIAAAHKRGIAHRDLKPGNVMVDDEGRVKVLDFGIAKLIEEETPEDEAATQMGSEALTEEGKIVGTVAYMSPEQAEGKAADHRTDIFSLGILLYEMATGDRPFVGDTKLSILASIVKDKPQPVYERNMEMPRHLARIVKKALEKNLDRRYQSMVELRNDLIELKEEIDAGEPLITGGTLTDPGAMDAYRRPAEPASSKGMWLGIAGVVVAAAAVGYAFFGPGSGPPAPLVPPTVAVAQLTTTGVDFGGTISPDGEWFAFARAGDDGYQLNLQSIGSRNPIALGASGVSPVFSRDGAHIAFSGPYETSTDLTLGGGIAVMGRTGDNLRRLSEEGFNPSWSPDGSKIVYALEYVQNNPYSRTGDSRLFILDVASGEAEALEGVADGVQPNWSPNGRRIAYWGLDVGQRDLWTIAATGGEPVRVTNDDAVDFSPVWSPDGRWLYFASTRGGSMAIWRVAMDEESGKPSGEPQAITTGGLSESGMLSFSADGSKLMYTETLTRGTILAADFDPDTLQITSNPVALVKESRRIYQAEISNDGTRLVYRTGGARQDLYVAGVDDDHEQQITDDVAKDWAPRWSPNDDRIAYYSNANGFYEVWVVQPDGTGPTRLTNLPPEDNPLRPTWSPDGTKIIFSVRDKTAFIIDAGVGYAEQRVDPLPKIDGREDSWFRASDWRRGEPAIVGEFDGVWVYDTQTRKYEQLVDGIAAIGSTWLADGRRILYSVPGTSQLFVVDRITKDIWEITAPPAQSVVLSANNRRIYLVREEAESDIWLAEFGQR